MFFFIFVKAFSCSVIGPTLPNLEVLLETELGIIGQGLAVQNGGSLLGAIIVIMFYDRINPGIKWLNSKN